jgi:hypothetical protein
MGVVHKLKEDVVTFIVAQKKQYPTIGVRKLALLASEKFQINISKSSVNNVLKNASLSSVVGRRVGSTTKVEKFSIPSTRKIEISKSMLKAGFVKESKAVSAEAKDLSIIDMKKDNALPLISDPLEDVQPPSNVSNVPLEETTVPERNESELAQHVTPDYGFLEQVEKFRALKIKKGVILKGMGLVFLKAAQWAISSRHLMEYLIKKCLKGNLSGHFNVASDMYLFFQFLGVRAVDDISSYQDHGIWPLNGCTPAGVDKNNDLSELKQLFQGDSTFQTTILQTLIMEYGIEKENAFLEVKGYKLYLEDGSELIIDANMSSLGSGSYGQSLGHNCLPVNKALTLLSNCLISNIQDCVFERIPGEVKFSRSFYDMVSVFENFPGKRILRVTLITDNADEFAEFSTIPAQKRFFMAGVDPCQEQFRELTQTVRWVAKRPYYHEEIDRVYYFAETKSDFLEGYFHWKKDGIRVLTIWKQKDKDPIWAIVTNQEEGSGKKILEKYISTWPYFDAVKQEVSRLMIEPLLSAEKNDKIGNFSGIFRDFAYSLHQYASKRFFQQNFSLTDVNNFISCIYSKSGRIYKSDDSILVTLDLPQTYKYLSDLEYAVRRVNESQIYDSSGRRLWINISHVPIPASDSG